MGLSPLKMAYTLWSMFLLWLLLYSEKTPMPLDCFGKTEKKYSISDHYAGHLYSALCQLFLNKTGRKKSACVGLGKKRKLID